MYILGAGLLTYGHMEVVEDILDNIPDTKGQVRRCVLTVTTLLPVPTVLDPFRDTAAVKQWFLENRDGLYWDQPLKLFNYKRLSES